MTEFNYIGVGGAITGGAATTAKVDAILVKEPPKPPSQPWWKRALKFVGMELARLSVRELFIRGLEWLLSPFRGAKPAKPA